MSVRGQQEGRALANAAGQKEKHDQEDQGKQTLGARQGQALTRPRQAVPLATLHKQRMITTPVCALVGIAPLLHVNLETPSTCLLTY